MPSSVKAALAAVGLLAAAVSTPYVARQLVILPPPVVPVTPGQTYEVKADGTGNFTTIQACANIVQPGETCLVFAGTYPEHVDTVTGGTSHFHRVTFRARGLVTMQGFDVQDPYVTITGFDITGYTVANQGLVTVFTGGDHLRLLNNNIHDNPTSSVFGIYVYPQTSPASYGVFSGNTIKNINGVMISTGGSGHLFEHNLLAENNLQDFIRLFGSHHVFRRNIVKDSTTAPGGNHPDFIQTFGMAIGLAGNPGGENNVIEENWIENLTAPNTQFGNLKMNYGGATVLQSDPVVLLETIRNWTFRRNVFVNIPNNGNMGLPRLTFDHNTFYQVATTQVGLVFSGSPTRGSVIGTTVSSNVFLAGGTGTTTVGFYTAPRHILSEEAIAGIILACECVSTPASVAMFADLVANGYLNTNGFILAAAVALSNISQFVYDPLLTNKQEVYDLLIQTRDDDLAAQATFIANYNYVAGASPGFTAKSTAGCPVYPVSSQIFCEANGINGGNPSFASLVDVDGPDNLPFTLDDGLKPVAGSILCGVGEGGSDIGAYSCDPTKVFP